VDWNSKATSVFVGQRNGTKNNIQPSRCLAPLRPKICEVCPVPMCVCVMIVRLYGWGSMRTPIQVSEQHEEASPVRAFSGRGKREAELCLALLSSQDT